ncbi:MAG: alpha-galactosidase, partial [Chitinophagaceae bacterium]
MKFYITALFCILISIAFGQQYRDWLIKPPSDKSVIQKSSDGKNITISNGLVQRSFRLQPNLVCIDYKNLVTGQQLLRAVAPEAVITIDGREYNIGGLNGQKEKAYLLPEWLETFTKGDNDFEYVSYSVAPLQPFVKWKPEGWWATNKKQPEGKVISFGFSHKDLKHLQVNVHYAIYDGIPLIAKWLTIENKGAVPTKINRVKSEVIALVEEESAVVGKPDLMKKPQGIYFETNYAFNNAMRYDISDQTTHYKIDSSY